MNIVNALLPTPAERTSAIPADAFTSEPEVTYWRGYVGILRRDRTPNLRVWVQITKTLQSRPARAAGLKVPGWQTTDHREVYRRHGYSFVGLAIPEGSQRAVQLGQVSGLVADTRWDDRRAGGLLEVDRLALVALWHAHHLNAERMGCEHQSGPESDPCPSSGYVYGDDRLLEPVDPKLRARISQVGVALNRTLGERITWPREESL